MKMTMRELAEKTGFSPATISRVITRKANVNAATRAEVEKALRKIDYTPVRTNRKKYAKKTVLIISGAGPSNFYTRLFATMAPLLHARGYYVLNSNICHDDFLTEHYVEYAQMQEFCGIIMLTPIDSPSLVKRLSQPPCPVVLVDRYLRSIDLDAVYMDNYRAGYMVGKYLHDMGHRRIVCLVHDKKPTSVFDRVTGFTHAMEDLGVGDYLLWNELESDAAGGNALGREYLSSLRKYTAVFCLNEPMTRAFVDTVQEGGLDIPRDVSVIGIAPTVMSISGNVKLTCVINNPELLGQTAVDMLMDRLGGLEQAPRKIVFPPQLSIQNSVLDLSREIR